MQGKQGFQSPIDYMLFDNVDQKVPQPKTKKRSSQAGRANPFLQQFLPENGPLRSPIRTLVRVIIISP
jgi:hypothetical protein